MCHEESRRLPFSPNLDPLSGECLNYFNSRCNCLQHCLKRCCRAELVQPIFFAEQRCLPLYAEAERVVGSYFFHNSITVKSVMMVRYMQQGLKIHLYLLLGVIFSAVVVHAAAEKGEKNQIITEGSNVSVEYTLTLQDEGVIDTNKDGQPLTFVYGAKQIIPGLEKAMTGMKIGESKNVTVQPEDGYGPVLEEAIIEVGKDQLPADAWQIGAHIQGQSPEGQVVRGQVKQLQDDMATIDFNHPLAGKTLFFEVKVLDIQ